MKIRDFLISGMFGLLVLIAPTLELKGLCMLFSGIYFIQGIKSLHNK